MNPFVLIPLICYSYILAAQNITTKPFIPDSCNKVDAAGIKQGHWIEFSGPKGARSYKESRGEYKNGAKDKTWVDYAGDGPTLVKIENYNNGQKEGLTLEMENGALKKEEWYKADKLHGLIRTYSFGSRLSSETQYTNGIMTGFKNTWYQNGKKQEEGFYVNGKREGKVTWYYEDGKKSIEYTYVNGDLNGPMKTCHKSEIVATEGSYLQNEFDGPFKEYHPDGKLKAEGSYIKGQKDGIWKEYNEKGELSLTQKFKLGVEKK
jgi:antitoxin component YwqK of YwqJK toxin-antitoxin module